VRAGEGTDHNLPEERDTGEEDGGLASLLAVGALGLCDGGWIAKDVRSRSPLILRKGFDCGSWIMVWIVLVL
jgi:hypothetical protein